LWRVGFALVSCQVINLKPWRPAVPSFYGASSTGMQLLALRLSTEQLGWPCGCAGCLQVIAIVARSDSTRAASIGVDGCLRLWDAATGICISNKVRVCAHSTPACMLQSSKRPPEVSDLLSAHQLLASRHTNCLIVGLWGPLTSNRFEARCLAQLRPRAACEETFSVST
jgi:hypothetical protein